VGKKEKFYSKVTGLSYDDPITGMKRQDIVRRYIKPGMRLIPQREPDNPHDKHAIKYMVTIPRFLRNDLVVHLGYSTREVSRELSRLLDNDIPIDVTVSQITGGSSGKRTRGVNVLIQYEAP
jgi:hypothetical protein